MVHAKLRLQENHQLRCDRFPDKMELRTLRDCGLGVSDQDSEGTTYMFYSMWGPTRMHDHLRKHLPKLFKYLARMDPWVLTVKANDDESIRKKQLPYVLLFRKGKGLHMVENVPHPSGADYKEFKGGERAAWAASKIIIGEYQL